MFGISGPGEGRKFEKKLELCVGCSRKLKVSGNLMLEGFCWFLAGARSKSSTNTSFLLIASFGFWVFSSSSEALDVG